MYYHNIWVVKLARVLWDFPRASALTVAQGPFFPFSHPDFLKPSFRPTSRSHLHPRKHLVSLGFHAPWSTMCLPLLPKTNWPHADKDSAPSCRRRWKIVSNECRRWVALQFDHSVHCLVYLTATHTYNTMCLTTIDCRGWHCQSQRLEQKMKNCCIARADVPVTHPSLSEGMMTSKFKQCHMKSLHAISPACVCVKIVCARDSRYGRSEFWESWSWQGGPFYPMPWLSQAIVLENIVIKKMPFALFELKTPGKNNYSLHSIRLLCLTYNMNRNHECNCLYSTLFQTKVVPLVTLHRDSWQPVAAS
jgi:hypothetical protein